MDKSILLIGVGGQGTILMSKILSEGLMMLGFDVKMSEIHGMSQRGGSVTTQVKFGQKVYAPNIGVGEADIIVAFEKSEALRALKYLKKDGLIIIDEKEIYPVSVLIGKEKYPEKATEEIRSICKEVMVIPAADIAENMGNSRAQNIVLLGALVKVLNIPLIDWEKLIETNVPPKAKEMNINAFRAGSEI